jgi:hypothetical protein
MQSFIDLEDIVALDQSTKFVRMCVFESGQVASGVMDRRANAPFDMVERQSLGFAPVFECQPFSMIANVEVFREGLVWLYG